MVPGFYRGVSMDAYVYAAITPINPLSIPVLTFVKSGVVLPIKRADTKSAFLYEKIEPVYFQDQNQLLFKNLDVEYFSTSLGTSYTFDLSSIASYIQEDTFFAVKNSYADIHYIDYSSSVFTSTGLKVYQDQGYFLIYYKNTDSRTRLLAGQDYITVDGKIVSLYETHVRNLWDEYAWLMGIKRNLHESNSRLKKRCQQLSYLADESARISAALHRTAHFYWGTGSSITFTASTWNRVYIPDLKPKFKYIETLYKDGNQFVFKAPPTASSLQVWNRGRALDSTEYTLSGSYLTLNPTGLLTSPKDIRAFYAGTFYSYNYNSSGYIQSITPYNSVNYLLLGFTSSGATVTNSTKRIKEWRWNTETGLLVGTAYFDF